MKASNKHKHLNLMVGVLFLSFIFFSCHSSGNRPDNEFTYVLPVDSFTFDYKSKTRKSLSSKYSENRYGRKIVRDKDGTLKYLSIDSDKQLHQFLFKSNSHTYSEKICNKEIDGYMIDSSLIYLLYDSTFYIKDFNLSTIDSFKFRPPSLTQKHGIDFSGENGSNLFRFKEYFFLMYYVIDKLKDGDEIYRNSDYLFYFFNKDTAFFASKGCEELQETFQYFRYPSVANNNKYIFHAPKVLNCISKSNEERTKINASIDSTQNHNYLKINHSDQFVISRLKKYRFSTDYNKNILLTDKYVLLLKEIPERIYLEENVRKYDIVLQIDKFDLDLNFIKSFYIKDKSYSEAYVEKDSLYLFKLNKNKTFVYEI